MALQFTVVRRKDMRKNAAADSKLFYGQTKAPPGGFVLPDSRYKLPV